MSLVVTVTERGLEFLYVVYFRTVKSPFGEYVWHLWNFSWAVFCNEQTSNRWPFFLRNHEQIVVGKPRTKDKKHLRADRSKNQQLWETALHECSAPSNVDSCSLSPVFDTWHKMSGISLFRGLNRYESRKASSFSPTFQGLPGWNFQLRYFGGRHRLRAAVSPKCMVATCWVALMRCLWPSCVGGETSNIFRIFTPIPGEMI